MSEKQLVSFGEYLLSKEREENLKLTNTEVPNLPRARKVCHWEEGTNTMHYDKTRL